MALSIRVLLGGDVFEAEGDFSFNEGFQNALRAWINARGDDTGDQLEQLAIRLDQSTADLADAVAANTPASQPQQ